MSKKNMPKCNKKLITTKIKDKYMYGYISFNMISQIGDIRGLIISLIYFFISGDFNITKHSSKKFCFILLINSKLFFYFMRVIT